MARRGSQAAQAQDASGTPSGGWGQVLRRAREADLWGLVPHRWAADTLGAAVRRGVAAPADQVLRALGRLAPEEPTEVARLDREVGELGRRLRSCAESQRRHAHTLAALAGRLDMFQNRLDEIATAAAASAAQGERLSQQSDRLRTLERRVESLASSVSVPSPASGNGEAVTPEQIEEIWEALSGLAKLYQPLRAATGAGARPPDLQPAVRP